MQRPDKLYIEEKIKDHPFTGRVLTKLDSITLELVEDYKRIGQEKPFPVRAVFRKKHENFLI